MCRAKLICGNRMAEFPLGLRCLAVLLFAKVLHRTKHVLRRRITRDHMFAWLFTCKIRIAGATKSARSAAR